MAKYVIRYDECGQFEMNGEFEDILASHLVRLLNIHGIREDAWSESHALAILREHNIHITLENEYGEPLDF